MENNVPKLRFPEFEGEWEEDIISSLFKVSAGGDIQNENVRCTKDDIFKYPIYANAEKDKGFYGYSDTYKVDENVITVAGRGVNLGIAHARNHKFYPIVRLLVLEPKDKVDIFFFEYAINQINLYQESTGVPQLTAPQISKYKIKFPTLPEQTKIASFLTAVDEKISQLKKKKELLEQYKKGVMQQIFSQQLRFKDDNGEDFEEWEEKKLGEIINFLADYTANGSFASLKDNVTYYNEENYAVLVRTTDLEKRDFTPERFTDKRGYDFLKKTSLFGGELVLANVGSIGKVYKVPFYNKPMTLAPNTYTIRLNNDNSLEYVYQWMTSNDFLKKILSMVGSSTLKAINKSNLRDIEINCPSLPEQTKIANFLSAIDDKISHCGVQIEKMEGWKKGLLQQMFV